MGRGLIQAGAATPCPSFLVYTLFLKVFDDSLGVFLEPDSRLFACHIIGCGEGAQTAETSMID